LYLPCTASCTISTPTDLTSNTLSASIIRGNLLLLLLSGLEDFTTTRQTKCTHACDQGIRVPSYKRMSMLLPAWLAWYMWTHLSTTSRNYLDFKPVYNMKTHSGGHVWDVLKV
jgi:hypothetical protein